MSPGDCSRSTGSARRSVPAAGPSGGALRARSGTLSAPLSQAHALDRCSRSSPFRPITTRPGLRSASGDEPRLHARADRLHRKRRGASVDRHEPLDAQHAVDRHRGLHPRLERRAIGSRHIEHERIEIVVVVLLAFELVMALAIVGCRLPPPRTGRAGCRPGSMPLRDADGARLRPAILGDRLVDAREARRVDQVGLGDRRSDRRSGAGPRTAPRPDRHARAKILGALLGELRLVGGDAALRHRRRIDHRHHAVDGHAAFTLGQVKAFTSGCGSARPDVSMTMWSGGIVAAEDLLHRRAENRRRRCSRCSRWRAR